MIIKETKTNQVIAKIVTNRNLSIDDAMRLTGWNETVCGSWMVNGQEYYNDDLVVIK